MKRPARWEMIRDLMLSLSPGERAKIRAILVPLPFTGGAIGDEGWLVLSELGCVSREGRAYVAAWLKRYVDSEGYLPPEIPQEVIVGALERTEDSRFQAKA